MINEEHENWKSFRFDEIFIIKGGFYNKKPKFDEKGDIAFIGATNSNNGVTGFCLLEDIINSSKMGHGKNHDLKYKLFKGNCITVTNNGSVGHAYYQKNEFTCSHDINVLYLKNHELNKYIAMFLIVAIEQQKSRFAYSRKWRPMRMKSSNLILPINNNELPDYEFMEQYMKDIEKKTITKYNKKIKTINEDLKMKDIDLNSISWEEFYIKEVFEELQRGKRLIKDDFIDGTTPFISSSATNNGVDSFIGNNENIRTFNDCLTLANSGSVGSTFYHPYQFVASDHVTHLKNDNFNKYIYLFFASVIKRLESKYNFNREINDTRLKNEIILLPITETGDINYEFMENYMKNEEAKLITKYLNYLKK